MECSTRTQTVLEKLERAMLQNLEPPSHVTARRQLKTAGIEVWPERSGIVAVRPECIIYRTPKGLVCTAWSEVRDQGKKIVFYCERGMPAFAPAERDAA